MQGEIKMEYAAILIAIWGLLVIFVGIFIHRGNNIFPARYSVPNNPVYLKRLGDIIIIVGFAIIFFAVGISFF
jgi:hypothetical protein